MRWGYGDVKDPDATPPTHPCIVPFDQLPREQQIKDALFRSVVKAVIGAEKFDEPSAPQGSGPRLSIEGIKAKIVDRTFHVFENTQLTVCVLTLQNGFTVVGQSACASPENYDREIGETVAEADAVREIWKLEGYLLKQAIFEEKVQKLRNAAKEA